MRTISQIAFVMVLLTALVSVQGAEAATYYVATTGNDMTGDGSIGLPWLTVPEGLRALHAGDTLYIRRGTYNIDSTYGIVGKDTYGCIPTCPTSWATATRVMNYPGEAVMINHRGFNMDNAISTGGVAYFIWKGDARANFVHQMNGTDGDITGFRVSNAVHHIRMQTMTIRNFDSHGIKGGSASCTLKPAFIEILDNEVRNNGDNSYGEMHEHGIYPSCGNDWRIDGNYFVGNYAYGIHVYSPNSGWLNRFKITRNTVEGRKGSNGTTAGIMVTGGSGHIVANNLVIGQGRQANKLSIGIQIGSGAVSPAVYNNTVYDVPTGIQLLTASDAVVRNNLLNAVTTNIQDQGSNTKSSNLCTAADSGCSVITSTPGFVRPGSNFRLAAGSLAIDAGATVSTVTTDCEGVPRPQGGAYDIGAYEGDTGSDGQPPSIPLGLKIY